MGLFDGFLSLGSKINKTKGYQDTSETEEGAVSDLMPLIDENTPDNKLEELTKKWKSIWDIYKGELENKQNDNENYWLGKHYSSVEMSMMERPFIDNLIFESVETFLPIATAQNPEPVVSSDESEEGQKFAELVKDIIVSLADDLRLRLRIKTITRYWALYLLGAAKIAYSDKEDNVTVRPIRPQKLILDSDATINEDMEYTGDYIGEYRQDTVDVLIRKFPKAKTEILKEFDNNKGTKIQYIEWWTDRMVFWTLNNKVLDKIKNPHFNYEEETKKTVDKFGQEIETKLPPLNHFRRAKKPYIFLSINNLGKHPYDDVSLIGQNLSLQNMVNKRLRQIDVNVDDMNGGWGLSGESGIGKKDAARAIETVRRGGAIYTPQGKPRDVLDRFSGTPLPNDVYASLQDYRNEIRNIFGVRGSSPQGIMNEQTVRGKIITKGQDTSRIGGGVTEYLEQFADNIYNWFVQLIYVYYDDRNVERILGKSKTDEFFTLIDLARKVQLQVSVKEGSLIPKDELTKRNEAIDLWSAGAIDPITLFERLGDANPQETAKKLYLWKTAPEMLFQNDPEVAQVMAQQQAAQMQELAAKGKTGADLSNPLPQGTPPSEGLEQVPIQ